MPYIDPKQREKILPSLDSLSRTLADFGEDEIDGVLNYVISTLVARGINPMAGDWKYAKLARAVAALECAKLEFYRRIAGPKEDKAKDNNGDIDAYKTPPLPNTTYLVRVYAYAFDRVALPDHVRVEVGRFESIFDRAIFDVPRSKFYQLPEGRFVKADYVNFRKSNGDLVYVAINNTEIAIHKENLLVT